MVEAKLYFLSNQYYKDFPDDKLMRNKESIKGVSRSRPCFFAFPDTKNPSIYWIVPISSKYEKYKRIEQGKIAKYGRCITIRFGKVLGRDAAFLIQNMCPATAKYLVPYIDSNNNPVQIDYRIAEDVTQNAQKVLSYVRQGKRMIFPDIFKIYAGLEAQLKETKLTTYLSDVDKPEYETSNIRPSVLGKLNRAKQEVAAGRTDAAAAQKSKDDPAL